MRIYEGMFVLDDARSNSNWDRTVAEVRGLLDKHRAEIFSCERWDERRLAYTIRGRHRAVYLLTRFTAPLEAIGPLRRDCQLSDTILRVLFVRDIETEKLHKAGLFPPKPEGPDAGEGEAQPEQPTEGEPPADTTPDARPDQPPTPDTEDRPPAPAEPPGPAHDATDGSPPSPQASP